MELAQIMPSAAQNARNEIGAKAEATLSRKLGDVGNITLQKVTAIRSQSPLVTHRHCSVNLHCPTKNATPLGGVRRARVLCYRQSRLRKQEIGICLGKPHTARKLGWSRTAETQTPYTIARRLDGLPLPSYNFVNYFLLFGRTATKINSCRFNTFMSH